MTHKETDVSIIIPAYNAEKYLRDSVESIVHHDNVHIIIVNDGSTDGTQPLCLALCADYANVTALYQANQGVSAARNLGLAHARGEFVLFLDADDRLIADGVTRLRAMLTSLSQHSAVFGNIRYLDQAGNPTGLASVARKPLSSISSNSLLHSNFIDTLGAVLMRTASARQVGGFDCQLKAGEDWEFYYRLLAMGAISYVDADICQYRIHADSAMSTLSEKSFYPSITKVSTLAKQRGINRLHAFNARQRKFASVLLLVGQRSACPSQQTSRFFNACLCQLQSIPYCFSPMQLLRAIKHLCIALARRVNRKRLQWRIN